MLGPGPENVSLLGHAGASSGLSSDHILTLASSQTSRSGVIELLLNLWVPFAALAIGSSPDRRFILQTATGLYAAASEDQAHGHHGKPNAADPDHLHRQSIAREQQPDCCQKSSCERKFVPLAEIFLTVQLVDL